MTATVQSWENILYLVQVYYREDLKPYYDETYVDICLDIISRVIGKPSFEYVLTIESLPEPIMTYRKIIVLSAPMLENLLDRPVCLPQTRIENVKNFDIFETFDVLKNDPESCVNKSEFLVDWLSEVRAIVNTKAPGSGSGVSSGGVGRHARQFTRLTNSQITSLIMLVRLVVCIAHWAQHYRLRTNVNDHSHHQDLEFAELEDAIDDNNDAIQTVETAAGKRKRAANMFNAHRRLPKPVKPPSRLTNFDRVHQPFGRPPNRYAFSQHDDDDDDDNADDAFTDNDSESTTSTVAVSVPGNDF